MSLINDVLQQLDARVPVVQPGPIYVANQAAADTGKIRLIQRPFVRFGSLVIVGLLSGYYSMAAFQVSLISDREPVTNSLLLDPLVAGPPVHSILLNENNTSDELTLTGSLFAIGLSSDQSELAKMLLAAQQFYRADRLTYPPLNNAYQLYREVLLKDPVNETALNGIVAIKARYVILASEAISRQDFEKAQRYVERAEFIGVDPTELERLRMQVNTLVGDENKISGENYELSVSSEAEFFDVAKTTVKNYAPIAGDRSAGASDRPVDAVAIRSANTPSAVNSLKERIPTNPGSLSNLKNSEKVEEQNFLVSVSADPEGEVRVLNYIKSHPNSSDTVRWLARRWVNQQAWLQLLDLMNVSSALTTAERDVFRAQGLMGLKKYSEIIGWLGGSHTSAQPELQRILAVAWQQTGRQEEAFAIYQRLVTSNPDNSGLWLALGISADATGNKIVAHQAYVQAYQLGGHSNAVNEFIGKKLNRISPLNSNH